MFFIFQTVEDKLRNKKEGNRLKNDPDNQDDNRRNNNHGKPYFSET